MSYYEEGGLLGGSGCIVLEVLCSCSVVPTVSGFGCARLFELGLTQICPVLLPLISPLLLSSSTRSAANSSGGGGCGPTRC